MPHSKKQSEDTSLEASNVGSKKPHLDLFKGGASQSNSSHSGFSLVELIMTIAIITVIGIVGFVSFGAVSEKRENSKRVSDVEMFRSTVDTIVLQSGEVPEPTANKQYYRASGAYSHSSSGSVGVSSYLSPDILGKFALADHPRDPKTGSFYAFGKSYSTPGEYQIAAVLMGTDGPSSLVGGKYNASKGVSFGNIAGLIKAYNSSEFLVDGDTQWLPYNPLEKVVSAFITDSSGSVNISPTKTLSAPILQGDTLVVGTGSTATLKISDGTEVILGSESNLTTLVFSKLALKDDSGLLTQVRLTLGSGRILAKAPKLREMSDNERSDVQIESGGAVAAVRGTIFGLDAGSGGGAVRTVTLVEGKIQMLASDTENPIAVQVVNPSEASGYEGEVSRGSNGFIEVFEGGSPVSVRYNASERTGGEEASSPTGGGNEIIGVDGTNYHAPTSIAPPYLGDSLALSTTALITGAQTQTLALSNLPTVAGKIIAPIHMSITGSLSLKGGETGALTWGNSQLTGTMSMGGMSSAGFLELRYEEGVVGTGSLKVFVVGKLVNPQAGSDPKPISGDDTSKIRTLLDPIFSGTGNIFVGDLGTSLISGETSGGYTYTGRSVLIPISTTDKQFSEHENLSFILCKTGGSVVQCSQAYNVSVDAWMVGSDSFAYSRIGTKQMTMGKKGEKIAKEEDRGEEDKEGTSSCTRSGWTSEACGKIGDSWKDPTLVAMTAFTGSCENGQSTGDLNMYVKDSIVSGGKLDVKSDNVAIGYKTSTGDNSRGGCQSSNSFSSDGVIVDSNNNPIEPDYIQYNLENLLTGNYRLEIEFLCGKAGSAPLGSLFFLKEKNEVNGNDFYARTNKDLNNIYFLKINSSKFAIPLTKYCRASIEQQGSPKKIYLTLSGLGGDDKTAINPTTYDLSESNLYNAILYLGSGYFSPGDTAANQWNSPIRSVKIYKPILDQGEAAQ